MSFQLLIVPVSEAATSWTRSFQVPLAVSLEASTVYVALTLSAESEVLEAFSA